MRPFTRKNKAESSGIKKLFNKGHEDDFLVDVNNLLADNNLNEITPGQISALAERYKIKNPSKKFGVELAQLLGEFLAEHLGNQLSSTNDFQSAKTMQQILGISDLDFEKEYKPKAIETFRKQSAVTLKWAKKYQDEEEAQLRKLGEQFGLSNEQADQITVEIRTSIVQDYIKSMIADFRVSPEEIKTYETLCKDLSVSVSMDDASKRTLEKYKRLWKIENGDLPVCTADIILQKSEVCHFKTNAELYEDRKVTTGVKYAGPTYRMRIAKGLYYRMGNISTARKSEDVMTLIDSGVLYITNKRILFNGSKGSKPIRYSQIVDLTPYSDGIKIVRETGKPQTFIMSYPDGEALTAFVTRMIKDSQE